MRVNKQALRIHRYRTLRTAPKEKAMAMLNTKNTASKDSAYEEGKSIIAPMQLHGIFKQHQ